MFHFFVSFKLYVKFKKIMREMVIQNQIDGFEIHVYWRKSTVIYVDVTEQKQFILPTDLNEDHIQ